MTSLSCLDSVSDWTSTARHIRFISGFLHRFGLLPSWSELRTCRHMQTSCDVEHKEYRLSQAFTVRLSVSRTDGDLASGLSHLPT